MKRLKENDRGFSLVEVLVAVMILAIVITPFLHSFVTTANTNRKAKENHRATVLAQSIVENCKAETLESITKQFDYPTDAGFRIMSKDRINGGSSWQDNVKELCTIPSGGFQDVLDYDDLLSAGYAPAEIRPLVTASTYSEDGGINSEFLGQSGGIYYFGMKNVKEDTASYDVLVKLNANDYKTGGEHSIAYNETDLAQLPIIDADKDAICVQRDDYTETAVSEFYAKFQASLYPVVVSANPTWAGMTPAELAETATASAIENAIKAKISRELTREITVNITAGEVKAVYKYTYIYGGNTETYVKDQLAFSSAATTENLRAVYLYYYPLYGRTVTTDVIRVNNDDSMKIDFYLFKQTRSTANIAGPVPDTVTEDGYRMSVQYFETAANPADLTTLSAKLHTNLGINLAVSDPSDAGYALSTPPKIYINGAGKNLSEVAVANVVSEDAHDRVFDLDVSIYKKDAMDKDYPESMRLAVISGTKLK